MNATGELIAPYSYIAETSSNTATGNFYEGLAGVFDPATETWGFVDTSGELVIPYGYDDANSFSEGKAIVWNYSVTPEGMLRLLVTAIDRNGTELFAPRTDVLPASFTYSEGLVPVHESEGLEPLHGYLNEHGELAIPLQYGGARDFTNGLAAVSSRPTYEQPLYGFIDHSGRRAIPEVVASRHADAFATGDLVPYQDAASGLWGYYAKDGTIALEPQFSRAEVFSCGRAYVELADGTHAFIDEQGSVVFTMPYEIGTYTRYWNDTIVVKDPETNRYGYLDTNGNVAIPFSYSEANPFSGGSANFTWARTAETGEGVILAPDGTELIRGVERYDHAETDDYLWIRTGTADDGVSGVYDIYQLAPKSMPDFTDVDSSAWYMTGGWVEYVVQNGIMAGYPGNMFGPEDSVTRGQVATILYRHATGKTDETTDNNVATPFWDVPAGHYCAAAVEWAATAGVVNGNDDGSFNPDAPVTREALATMIARYAAYAGAESKPASGFGGLSGVEQVSGWASESVQWCIANGIINGRGDSIAAQDGATRAEMAKIATVLMRDVL